MSGSRPAYRKPIRRKPAVCKTKGCGKLCTKGERLCNGCKLDIEHGRYGKKKPTKA